MPSILVKHPHGRTEHPLYGHSCYVGRDPDNDIALADGELSRQHCVIERTSDGWRVRDLGSRNGTFIGGQRVTSALLNHGDRVRCGGLEMKFVDPEQSFGADFRLGTEFTSVAAVPTATSPTQSVGVDVGGRVAWGWIMSGAAVACLVIGATLFIVLNRHDKSVASDAGANPTFAVETKPAEAESDRTVTTAATEQAPISVLQPAKQTMPSEDWYLMRATDSSVEGPLRGTDIRRAHRWGELDDSVRVRKGLDGEWAVVTNTELGSGYGADEPQSGSEVQLDLEPIEYVRQFVDFKRFGMLDAAEDLLTRLTDIDANLHSSTSSTMKARQHFESIISQSSQTTEAMRRMRAAIRRARAQGAITDTLEDVARARLRDVAVKTHASGKGWQSYIVGDDWLSFFRVEGGWRLDLLPVTGMRNPDTGALTPGAIMMLTEWGTRPPINEQKMANIVLQVMPNVVNRIIPAIEDGCFESASQAEAAFKQAAHRESLLRGMDANGGDRDRALVESLPDPIEEACRRSRQRQKK